MAPENLAVKCDGIGLDHVATNRPEKKAYIILQGYSLL